MAVRWPARRGEINTVSALTDLSDVSTAAVTNRFALMANGTAYVGRALVEADISDLQAYLTTETFTSLVQDTTPQLGGDLQSNGADIDLADNDAVVFGTGSDFRVEYDGSNLLFTPAVANDGLNLKKGTQLKVYDSTDADYVEVVSDGTDGRINQSGGDALYLDNGVPGFGLKGLSLADDATGTWTLPDSRPGGMLFLTASSTTDNVTGEYAILYVDDAATITTIASSAATISVGNGTNPDVDGDINIWSGTQGIISVKNRRSATRRIQLYMMGA